MVATTQVRHERTGPYNGQQAFDAVWVMFGLIFIISVIAFLANGRRGR